MRVDQIHKLFREYACEFEKEAHVADDILCLLQTNRNIKKDIEESITEEWLKRVKEVGKFYVITESIPRRMVPLDIMDRRANEFSSDIFPFVRTTFMDFDKRMTNENEIPKQKIPSIRLCREKVQMRGYNTDRALGRYVDEAR